MLNQSAQQLLGFVSQTIENKQGQAQQQAPPQGTAQFEQQQQRESNKKMLLMSAYDITTIANKGPSLGPMPNVGGTD